MLGGVLTEYGSWRWCLLLNLPLTVAVLVPAALLLIESRTAHPLLPLRVVADRARGGAYPEPRASPGWRPSPPGAGS